MKRLIKLNTTVLLLLLTISGCAPKYISVKPTGPIQTTFSINKEYSSVWDGLMDVLIEKKYHLEVVEKDLGIITTKIKKLKNKEAAELTYSHLNAIYQILETFEQSNTIRIKEIPDSKVQIEILSSFEGINIDPENGNSTHILETNGMFEKSIIDALLLKI